MSVYVYVVPALITLIILLQVVIMPTKDDSNLSAMFMRKAKGSRVLHAAQWVMTFVLVYVVLFVVVAIIDLIT